MRTQKCDYDIRGVNGGFNLFKEEHSRFDFRAVTPDSEAHANEDFCNLLGNGRRVPPAVAKKYLRPSPYPFVIQSHQSLFSRRFAALSAAPCGAQREFDLIFGNFRRNAQTLGLIRLEFKRWEDKIAVAIERL